jgi:hypothetical protein
MITSLRYLSAWSLFLFSLWFLSNRFNWKIHRYLPIQFLVTITWYGYVAIYLIYHKIYKKDFSNMISFFLNLLLHYIPYYIITKKKPITMASIQFFIVVSGIYLYYLSKMDKTPFDVYFNDKNNNK